MQLDAEQSEVVNYLCNPEPGHLVVQALAGCGKTHTVLHAALELNRLHGHKTLILTYSKSLENDCSVRLRNLGGPAAASHCWILTFNAVPTRLFKRARPTVSMHELHRWCSEEIRYTTGPMFDLLVVDECQDLNATMCWVINHVRKYCCSPQHRVMLIGDFFQSIFATMHGSTTDFMVHPQNYFPSALPWSHLRLRQSHRIPRAVAQYLNDIMHASCNNRSWRPVSWTNQMDIICRMWGPGFAVGTGNGAAALTFLEYDPMCPHTPTSVVADFQRLCGNDDDPQSTVFLVDRVNVSGIKHSDVQTAASRDPIRNLMTRCSGHNWIFRDCHTPLDERLWRNKTLVCCVPTMKGRECENVFIYNLTGTHFGGHGEACALYRAEQHFSTLYTALTRAKKRLIVVLHPDVSRRFFLMRPVASAPPRLRRSMTPAAVLIRHVSDLVDANYSLSKLDHTVSCDTLLKAATTTAGLTGVLQNPARCIEQDVSAYLGYAIHTVTQRMVTGDTHLHDGDLAARIRSVIEHDFKHPYAGRQIQPTWPDADTVRGIQTVGDQLAGILCRFGSTWESEVDIETRVRHPPWIRAVQIQGRIDLQGHNLAGDVCFVEIKTSPGRLDAMAGVHQVALYGAIRSHERGVVPGLYVLQCDSWGCRVIQVSLANPVTYLREVIESKCHENLICGRC
jgi:hypothetical protein